MELGDSYPGSLAPESLLIITTLFAVCLYISVERGAFYERGRRNIEILYFKKAFTLCVRYVPEEIS